MKMRRGESALLGTTAAAVVVSAPVGERGVGPLAREPSAQRVLRISFVPAGRERCSSCAMSSRLTDAPRPTPHMGVALFAIVQQRSRKFRAVASPRPINPGTVMPMRRQSFIQFTQRQCLHRSTGTTESAVYGCGCLPPFQCVGDPCARCTQERLGPGAPQFVDQHRRAPVSRPRGVNHILDRKRIKV